ncbi:hypothetical protein BDP27DRAFT_559091 [Rhodocollybia butyracea]|uniref:Uncharacterized protein n=1 Tax=Rhodocollybia butyracea TaxID=206335 RepID=A0A9P5TYS2_9AGAR|nr:hypothetical protein BDP27DRAFT_559091 [Rhodocollybia butyracea]
MPLIVQMAFCHPVLTYILSSRPASCFRFANFQLGGYDSLIFQWPDGTLCNVLGLYHLCLSFLIDFPLSLVLLQGTDFGNRIFQIYPYILIGPGLEALFLTHG